MALNRKQTPIPVVPRQMKLVNPDGTPTRSGQLLLEQTLADSVSYGPAGGMADTPGLQDGALYVVQDGSEVLYQLQGEEWHYVAGTMWGTLSPDQRPVGLGANDAGLVFRTVDSDPQYSGRIFIWSGSQWVEATAVRFGTHVERLAAPVDATMNGTVWIETDRSEVIYQLQGTAWHFLAGTMWGTLSPDQRPADLGANDSGFHFGTTDTDAANAPREFIWSGSEWIETTLVFYGTHATRPAADEATPPRSLYIETDRGNVIYQQQANAWVYVAGVMDGTLTPDQRPAGLGANDAGFDFQATDQPRQFTWSGSGWVEVTPVRFGSHTDRLALVVGDLLQGQVYIETDRSEVIYQLQGTAWHFLAGTMWGTVSPDQRPTDLGANDAGFAFRGTDQVREWIWSGSTWVEVAAQTGDVQIAYAASNLTLTTTATAISGATLTLNRAGRYLITGIFTFVMVNDVGIGMRGYLQVGGSTQSATTVTTLNNNFQYASTSLQWIYQAASPGVTATLLASKDSGSGTSAVSGGGTSISAQWVSP